MRIKSRINFLIALFLIFFVFNFNLNAEEFNIAAKEILVDKENEILIGKGSVQAIDSEGKVINADKITYEKSREFLLIEGDVKIIDIDGNILTANKATYDKINEIITTYANTFLTLEEGYKIVSKNISYNTLQKILKSNESQFNIVNKSKSEENKESDRKYQCPHCTEQFTIATLINQSRINNTPYQLAKNTKLKGTTINHIKRIVTKYHNKGHSYLGSLSDDNYEYKISLNK